MTAFLKFLNDNAGALNLLFSAVVAIATVVYARLTARLVSETERLRTAATEPSIEITYRSRDESMSLLEVVVKNIGNGPAYNVKFLASASPIGVGADELLARLQKAKFFREGINLLLPGQEFVSFWTDVRQNFNEKLATTVIVKTTCSNIAGAVYPREHQIDLSELDGVEKIGTPPLLSMARSLEKMQGDLAHLASGFRKLKVETHSYEDRQRERAEWEKHRNEQIKGDAPKSPTPDAKPASDG